MVEQNIYQVIVDSLTTHVAVLDEHGMIIETNRAWQEFARKNGFTGPAHCIGLNYLAICEQGEKGSNAKSISQAIRQVINGEITEFFTQYPCHSSTEKRWFSLRITPYKQAGENKVLVTHDNITPIILAQEQLKEQEAELKEKATKLAESNIALKVLLEQRDKDKKELEEQFVAHIQDLVMPYLEKMRTASSTTKIAALLDSIDANLHNILSPFLKTLSTINRTLSPQEMEVAALVRQGKTSQEIADILHLSVATISFHRKNLRQKLGISKTGENLRAYLLSLQ